MFAGHWPRVTSGDWKEAAIVKTSATREIEKLKQQSGKDMVIWGSISLAQSLMNDGVIDEYQLIVCPAVLVEGRRLFDEHVSPGEMHLLSTRSFDRGTVLLSYSGEVVAAPGAC